MAERDDGGPEGYGDWRSLELAIKDTAKRRPPPRPGRVLAPPVSMRRSGRLAMTGSCHASSPALTPTTAPRSTQ